MPLEPTRKLKHVLIKARMRHRLHNRTFWKDHSCVLAREHVARVRILADQSAIFSSLRRARTHFLVGFLRRASPADSVSLPFHCP